MHKDMLKTAATLLRSLLSERDKLASDNEQAKIAREIVTQLSTQSELSSKDVLEKLAELESKTSDELRLIQKAIEYAGTREFMKLGRLSDIPTPGDGLDNLTAFLLNADQ
jgi:hypothetical protein